MNSPSLAHPFVVLVPVKLLAAGKSRLAGISDDLRRALALAFALDTVAAARATPAVREVVVVSSDPDVIAGAERLGSAVEPDTGDLNGSLRAAATRLGPIRPGTLPVALCSDLPALDERSLTQGLAQITDASAWFVADHEGTGTTMYAAPYSLFAPRFGVASRVAHGDAGAVEIAGGLPRLRRDVDAMCDLDALVTAGWLGSHTRDVLAGARTS